MTKAWILFIYFKVSQDLNDNKQNSRFCFCPQIARINTEKKQDWQ